MANRLRNLPDDLTTHPYPPPDYLFFSSFTYCYWLLFRNSEIIKTEIGRDLIVALLQYRARIPQPRKDIEVKFCDSENTFLTINWSKFVENAGACGIVLPRPTDSEEPPTDPTTIGAAKIIEESCEPVGDATIDVGVLGRQPSYDNMPISVPDGH